MNKLASLILTTTIMASGAAFAASGSAGGDASSQGGGNGQANQAADAGQVAPGAKENLAPNGVNNNNINSGSGTTGTTGGAMGSGTGTNSSSNTNSGSTGTLSGDGMTTDEVHKNTMCKDGRCPDVNKKVETGSGNNNDVNTKTDGTTH